MKRRQEKFLVIKLSTRRTFHHFNLLLISGLWDNSPHPDDINGTIAILDPVLQHLSHLIKEARPEEQTVSEVIMMEAFVNAITFYWQSEPEVQITIAHLIGDKHMVCLRQLTHVMHVECK